MLYNTLAEEDTRCWGGALCIIKDHTHFPTNITNIIVIYNKNTMLFILCSFRYQILYTLVIMISIGMALEGGGTAPTSS